MNNAFSNLCQELIPVNKLMQKLIEKKHCNQMSKLDFPKKHIASILRTESHIKYGHCHNWGGGWIVRYIIANLRSGTKETLITGSPEVVNRFGTNYK